VLTKTGSQVKLAFIMGGLRTAKLSPADRRLIEIEHGMEPNSNLIRRNMGRGLVGNIAGTLGGGYLGAAAGLALGVDPQSMKRAMLLGGVIGGVGAEWLATNKYSDLEVNKIRERRWQEREKIRVERDKREEEQQQQEEEWEVPNIKGVQRAY